MSKEFFFSVVVTTYNRANLLPRALASLGKQTFTSWEAILIDDGSTDDTHSKIKTYLESIPNLSYHYQENQGLLKAKNKGIQLSKGKFITFLDSDDEYARNHLQSRYDILQDDSEIDFLRGGVKIIGNEFVPDRHDPTKQIHLSECAISGSFFIKQELIQKLNGFKGASLGMDGDLLKRATLANAKVLKIEEPKTYIYHRDNLDSLTHQAEALYGA